VDKDAPWETRQGCDARVFHAFLLDHGEQRASRGDAGPLGVPGVPTEATTDLVHAESTPDTPGNGLTLVQRTRIYPRYSRGSGAMTASTGGTGGKTKCVRGRTHPSIDGLHLARLDNPQGAVGLRRLRADRFRHRDAGCAEGRTGGTGSRDTVPEPVPSLLEAPRREWRGAHGEDAI
jgi:hypothetical protein